MAEVQGTLVEVVCTPIMLQSNGLIFIILQFVYLANGFSITRHYECTGNINVQLKELKSTSNSRGAELNSQPEKWISRLELYLQTNVDISVLRPKHNHQFIIAYYTFHNHNNSKHY
jgi:hypothetical protein